MWKNLLISIKREKFLSLSTLIIMTITFTVLGFFLSLIVFSQTAVKYLENQAQITIFFKDDFSEKNILSLKEKYEKDKTISNVNYVSKEQALKIFTDLNKNEPILLESISANILPASLEIRAKRLSSLSALAVKFEKQDGVEEVRYFKDVIENFRFWSNLYHLIGLGLVLIFATISFSVVIALIRMTINSKGEELEILKLVGATDVYVKRPFIFQAVFFGLVSSILSFIISVVWILSLVGSKFFGDIKTVFILPVVEVNIFVYLIILGVILVLSGALLGYFGSLTAVKKYLKF
ncbi:hypothetical protein A3H26_03505 [candidate division WWE3 bacterium RIFCSPLOWO2_12_FULL_36_10]|uniref:Cell division protein FtsX n=1 Tax=candidate division WWE3 bacterium RIFCSPLOWO2_12_FULL_36_10 TaxID=1802630 RepID=A0A1F4VM44_UNCKA|nr:MAG: hypothetical protein A3H26_03505 [candidate division WWE3 bacterium RIFCSPLOWO2_12_FULL_36_10]